jgi:hypothetical protein
MKKLRYLTSWVHRLTSWDGRTYESGWKVLRFAVLGRLTFRVTVLFYRNCSRFLFIFKHLRITLLQPSDARLTNWVVGHPSAFNSAPKALISYVAHDTKVRISMYGLHG